MKYLELKIFLSLKLERETCHCVFVDKLQVEWGIVSKHMEMLYTRSEEEAAFICHTYIASLLRSWDKSWCSAKGLTQVGSNSYSLVVLGLDPQPSDQ